MTPRSFVVLLALVAACSLTGCKVTRMARLSAPLVRAGDLGSIDAAVLLLPIEDHRPDVSEGAGLGLSILPLVPYSTSACDGADNFEGTYYESQHLLATLFNELRAAQAFSSVELRREPGGPGTIAIRPEILSSWNYESLTFYGLSLPGDLFWVIGVPMGAWEQRWRLAATISGFGKERRVEASSSAKGLHIYIYNFDSIEKQIQVIREQAVRDLVLKMAPAIAEMRAAKDAASRPAVSAPATAPAAASVDL